MHSYTKVYRTSGPTANANMFENFTAKLSSSETYTSALYGIIVYYEYAGKLMEK